MSTPEQAPVPPPPPAPAPKPKMKLWKKILFIAGGVVLGLILLVLAIGPAIIGSVARSKITSALQQKLQAAVTVGDVSFSWTGHVQIEDFRLVPKDFTEPLVDVKKIDVHVSLGSAMSGKYIADVEVVAPKILIEKGADRKFNYQFPPGPPKERKVRKKAAHPGEKDEYEEEEKARPFVQANLKIRDGEVRIRGRGRETVYPNVSVSAKVDTLEKPITYDVALDRAMTVKGAIDLDKITGPATLTFDGFSLKNLTGAARAYSEVAELDGTVTGSFDYQLQGGPRFAGKGKLDIQDFGVTLPDRTVRLNHLTFSHDGSIDERGSGRHVIRLVGDKALNATIAVDVTDAFNTRVAKTDLQVDADLAGLGKGMAGTVQIRGTCSSKGPSQADLDSKQFRLAAEADLRLTGKNLDVNSMKLDRLDIHHVGTIDEQGTGRNTIVLESGKAINAKIEAQVQNAFGPAPAVTADLTASSDLGELGKLLEKAIGLKPDLVLEGSASLEGKIEAKGAEAAKGRVLLASTIATVDSATKKRTEIEPGLKLELAGGWDGKTKSASADVLQLTSSFATMEGKGGVSLSAPVSVKESTFQLKIDLEKLGGKLALFMKEPPKLTGTATANLTCAGEKITGVVSSPPADLRIAGVLRDGEGDFKIDGVTRPAELAKLTPKVRLAGAEITLSSAVAFSPKGATVAVKTSQFEWAEKTYTARAGLDAQIRYQETGTTGTTKLLNLEVIDEKKHVIREPEVTIVHDIGLADHNKTIDLRKAEIASSFLRGSVTGKIRRDPGLEFDKIRCAFKYIPEKLGAVAQPWLPGKLEGAEEKTLDVTLDGKASSTDVLAILRGTTGAVDLDLARFTFDGLTVSGKTQFRLKEGKLTSGTPLEVNKGRSELNASLDFNPPEKKPKSSLSFNAKNVDANGQMTPILERLNPIFHTHGIDAKVEGQIQADFKMDWSGPIDPEEKNWTAAASKALSGGGTFGAQNLTIAGSESVGKIMEAIGQGNVLQGELVATQIRIEDGKCTYKNMMLRGGKKEPASLKRDQDQLAADRRELADDKPRLHAKEYAARLEELKQREEDLPFRYTLRFSGWVKFDKTMQLKVQMPLTQNLIKSHPHLKKYLGSNVEVDLHGSTDKPSLDFNKMLTALGKRAAEGLLTEKATDLLGGLLKNKKRESEAEKLFGEAQKSEKDGNSAHALELYKKVQNDYRDTEFFKKKKTALEERISRLQGK